jgi:hypothetical protein
VSHRKQLPTTKTNLLLLFKEIIAVYCENYTKHKNTPCGQNAEFDYAKTRGTYSNMLNSRENYKVSTPPTMVHGNEPWRIRDVTITQLSR